MKKAFIIFTGFNQRAVIAFIRVLERHRLDYFLIASGKSDSIFQTCYADKVIFTRDIIELKKEYIVTIIKKAISLASDHQLIIAPTTEAINRFFLSNRDLFENMGISIPLVDKTLYEYISDKKTFGELCISKNISVPKEIDDPENCDLPFVAKPICYNSHKKLSPILVSTEKDREKLLRNNDLTNYFFQEFVNGRSLYLLLYLSKNGNVRSFSQENLIQQPQGKSIIAAVASDFHQSFEAEKYIEMLKSVGFFGLVMIEVRKKRDSSYFMIEANPRFWGPSQLFVDAMEEDLFDAFLNDNGISLSEPKTVKGRQYFWFQGLFDILSAGGKPVYHNYSSSKMAIDLPEWIESDIYRRNDTVNIFIKSLCGDLN